MIDKLNKAEQLANKLDKLNSHFDITTSTISELSEHINILVPDIDTSNDYDSDYLDVDMDIITIDLLKKDFMFMRDTLLNNINNGKLVIENLTTDLMSLEGNKNGEMIAAYAQLVGVVNNSMKLLSGTYKEIVSIQKSLVKDDKQDQKGNSYQQINMFGSVTDLISQIKEQSKENK